MEKAIFKFNGGLGALLCSGCRVIMRTAKDFLPEELKAIRGELNYELPPKYCEQCKSKTNGNNTKTEGTEPI